MASGARASRKTTAPYCSRSNSVTRVRVILPIERAQNAIGVGDQ